MDKKNKDQKLTIGDYLTIRLRHAMIAEYRLQQQSVNGIYAAPDSVIKEADRLWGRAAWALDEVLDAVREQALSDIKSEMERAEAIRNGVNHGHG